MNIEDIKVGDRFLVTDGAYRSDDELYRPPPGAYHFIRVGAEVVVTEVLDPDAAPENERILVKPVDKANWLNKGVDEFNYVHAEHLAPVPQVDPSDLGSVEAFLNG